MSSPDPLRAIERGRLLDDGESESFGPEEKFVRLCAYDREHRRPRSWMQSFWFYCAATLLAVCLLQAGLLLTSMRNNLHSPSYESGFTTELGGPRSAFGVSERAFGNAILDRTDGSMYKASAADGPHYTGDDLDAVDNAWDDLIFGRYVALKPDEVEQMRHSTAGRVEYLPLTAQGDSSDEIYGGPDMLHSLHCLNALRKHTNMERYAAHMDLEVEWRQIHLDHCVEQLRQAIMCHGYMTPVTIKPVVVNGTTKAFLGQTEQPHTCRNGLALRDWWRTRGEETCRLPVS